MRLHKPETAYCSVVFVLVVLAGFIPCGAAAQAASWSADFDGDNDVDLTDFAGFQGCFNGPNRPPAVFCGVDADLDDDNDVDFADFATFAACFNGPNRPPACAPVVPPAMVLIPAGEFQMGDTFNEGESNERPVHAVWVDAFYMDKYEVTNQQYADALNWANGQGGHITVTGYVVYKYNSGTSYRYCDTTTFTPRSRITWTGSTFGVVSGYGNHPMAQVSWYGSVAYANWRSAMEGRTPCYDLSTWGCNFDANGYRLPTEAEWEKAARGGASGRRFPWSDSDEIQHARANYCSLSSCAYDTSPTRDYHPTFNTGNPPYTSPVGYFAPNGYGLYDMAGNVWERCNDWYDDPYYSSSPYNNPQGPAMGSYRVERGGSWGDFHPPHCRSASRGSSRPDYRYIYSGFRVVCSVGGVD